MKKLLLKGLIFVPVLFLSLVLFVNYVIPPQYDDSYQRAITLQYDAYKKIKSNKIVFIGNSSLAYGLDLDLMEELSGSTCQILGNHAGIGLPYLMEMSKSNLRSGDTVVIEFVNNTIDSFGADLLLTGIENHIEMYRFFRPRDIDDVVKAYPSYVSKKINAWIYTPYKGNDGYEISDFDDRGNMILRREGCLIPEPWNDKVEETYKTAHWSTTFDKAFIQYLNEYIAYCKDRNVQVLFTCVPYLDESVRSTTEEIRASDEALSDLLDAPLVSDSLNYIYSRTYIYNAIAHCNSLGAEKRTRQLYQDIKPYIS